MQFSQVDYRDIQGLARFGYGHLPHARFLLAEIADAAGARAWLDQAIAHVTRAVTGEKPDRAMHIAFTFEGLRKLDLPRHLLEAFSHEFRSGMTEENRSRRLGDVDANAPAKWIWGAKGKPCPHILLMLYAKNGLGEFENDIKGSLWRSAFNDIPGPTTVKTNELEPFGFVDGVSQPWVDWDGCRQIRQPATAAYTNAAALGEFVLGYPNEYGYYTDRPLLDPAEDPDNILPLAEDKPGKRDLGRNGTYLVLRDLAQDVDGFITFVDAIAAQNPRKALELKTAMSGRVPADTPIIPQPLPDGRPPWRSTDAVDDPKRVIPPGGPAMPLSAEAIRGVGRKMEDVWLDQFTFQKDPDGAACPYGAHIRRANPRNADLPQGTRGRLNRLLRLLGFRRRHPHEDVLSSTRFHRILRRGRAYWERSEQAGSKSERGLRFVCLNGNIARQFEFIQTSWLANAKFSSLDEDDPLLGTHPPFMMATDDPAAPRSVNTNVFTRPQDNGVPCRVQGLRQFVTVRGGAYFFMPGIAALRYIARA